VERVRSVMADEAVQGRAWEVGEDGETRRDARAGFGDWVLGGSVGERQYWVWYPFTVGDLNLGMSLLFGFMLLETV
jgi:hypothetical protein